MKVISMIFMLIFVLLSVAFFSLFERKLLSLIHSRKGPNKVGLGGIFQPFSDAMKLISKVENHPFSSIKALYFLAPFLVFSLSLSQWILLPSKFILLSIPMGMLVILVFFSISIYGLIFSGWFSNSKYSLLGSGRAFSQSISYEIGLATVVICFCVLISTFNLIEISLIQGEMSLILPLFQFFILLFIFLLAETGRAPFDLPEGESELVGGYCIEYGGLSYTLIFLGENLSFLWASIFLTSLFFSQKEIVLFLVFSLVWVRAMVPRVRFDKLMSFFWIFLLPISLGLSIFFVSFWFY